MGEAADHTVPLSRGRRIMCDFLHASMSVPLVAIQKTMDLAQVASARQAAQPRPTWSSIFTKAYGRVVAATPELRRAFLTFPYERLYQYTRTTADVAVECQIEGESVVVPGPVRDPESRPLLDIDQFLGRCKANAIMEIPRFRRALRLAPWPRGVRRLGWWVVLNVSGRLRRKYFGTFCVTSVGGQGVDSLRPLAPCISLLHYGAIDARGLVTVRLTYDHRIVDGRVPAEALVRMEQVLNGEIIVELNALTQSESRPALPLAG